MLALITPTGGRSQQTKLCATFMRRQTFSGQVVWVVVDDVIPHTTDFLMFRFRKGWDVIRCFPTPAWQPGQNTQARNLHAAIRILRNLYDLKDFEAIFVIEDDDYYKPQYLERMSALLDGYKAAGENRTIYYNVTARTYCVNGNLGWSSLFQTAFIPGAVGVFETALYMGRFIDINFFRMLDRANLFHDENLSIGIKGMNGRPGIGVGHKRGARMTPDPELKTLREMIGDDVKYYYPT